jgi:hypothetical protein
MNLLNTLFGLDWSGTDRAAPAQFREAAGVTIDPDEDQWRPLTGDSRRDLSPMTQRRMQDLAVYLWQANPIANRLIELPVAYLLADGVKLLATGEDPDLRPIVQDWLDRMWWHPTNNFPVRLPERLRELAVFGEQCWPAFVNPVDGAVRYGYLDPSLVETVVTDPDNSQQPIGIVTYRNRKGQQKRLRVIVNGPEEELFTARTRAIRETFTAGECHWFAVNKLASERRGRSDLLPVMDWCDAYEQYLFGEVDRAGLMRAFIWDITLAGATPEEVAQRAAKIGPPSPGQIRVHNDSETWQAVTPDLKAADGAEGARLFRNHILGGLTIPEHWFGGAADVNRATGDSMGEPAVKLMSMRQSYLGYMLEECGRYQVRQREIATTGREPDLYAPEYRVQAQFPEMVVRDTTKYAAALQQVVAAANLAITNNLMTPETALLIIDSISGRLGVPIDAEDELAKAAEAAAKKAEADVFNTPPMDAAA